MTVLVVPDVEALSPMVVPVMIIVVPLILTRMGVAADAGAALSSVVAVRPRWGRRPCG